MRILSLCDGCSMLAVALEKANIPVEAYYSSEIDKNAIAVSTHNFPNHIRLGDVTKITNEQLDAIMPIDLVVFGSPCTSLSVANKNRSTGKDGVITGASAIFYDCHRILKYVNPKYYIMENVASATKECQQIITDLMGVQPVMLCASWFSPQRRRRLFWTNIPGVTEPLHKSSSVLKDILLKDNIPEKYFLSPEQLEKVRWINGKHKIGFIETNYNKESGLCASQGTRIYDIHGKQNALPSMSRGLEWIKTERIRKLTPVECERLMGLKDGYTLYGNYEGVTKELKDGNRYKLCGNGFHVDVISYILSFLNK